MSSSLNLGPRGQAIYVNYATSSSDPARLALAMEAARIADRLDELDSVIQGKGVLRLMQIRVLDERLDHDLQDYNINIEVKFQSVLGEARQQAIALGGILKTLGLEEVGEQAVEKKPAVTGQDRIAQKRAEREAKRKAQ